MRLKIFVQLLSFCKYLFGIQTKYLAMHTLGTTIPKIHHCFREKIFQILKFHFANFVMLAGGFVCLNIRNIQQQTNAK